MFITAYWITINADLSPRGRLSPARLGHRLGSFDPARRRTFPMILLELFPLIAGSERASRPRQPQRAAARRPRQPRASPASPTAQHILAIS
ncbi:hypothetical protein [Acidocella sp.]|uniref:hypothetical protein n=1 Tax=Acidocella sp. TaxID=50710 RepID=UPI002F40FCCD